MVVVIQIGREEFRKLFGVVNERIAVNGKNGKQRFSCIQRIQWPSGRVQRTDSGRLQRRQD